MADSFPYRTCMEIFSKDVYLENIIIELSVQKAESCTVVLTAKDEMNQIIWCTPVMDINGHIKTYSSVAEAFIDAERKIGAYRLSQKQEIDRSLKAVIK